MTRTRRTLLLRAITNACVCWFARIEICMLRSVSHGKREGSDQIWRIENRNIVIFFIIFNRVIPLMEERERGRERERKDRYPLYSDT